MKYLLVLFTILVFAIPANATVLTADTVFGEIYNNDDLLGTTTVTLTVPARKATIRNLTLGDDVLHIVDPASTSPSTTAFITLRSHEVCIVSVPDFSEFSTLKFWSITTCSVEIVAERK